MFYRPSRLPNFLGKIPGIKLFFLLYFPKKPGGKYCGVLAKHGLKRAPSYSLTLVLLLRSRGSPRTIQDTFLPLQLLERTITING